MPRYAIRLESPDLTRADGTPHYRETTGHWDSEDAARKWAVRREHEYCAYEHPDPENADRGQRCVHDQVEPYEVVSVIEAPKTSTDLGGDDLSR